MIREVKESADYDIPAYLYRGEVPFTELICDECGEETDALYELEGRQLCKNCLLNATKIAI